MDPKLFTRPIRSAAGGNGAGTRGRAAIRYEIREENGLPVGTEIIKRFYGATWRSIMGRLNHRHDGYLLTIYEKNQPLKIYRIFEQGP